MKEAIVEHSTPKNYRLEGQSQNHCLHHHESANLLSFSVAGFAKKLALPQKFHSQKSLELAQKISDIFCVLRRHKW